jgi:large subunit ribosomal protein L10
MGRTRDSKAEIITELKDLLGQSQLVLVIDYQGLSMAEITRLRDAMFPLGTVCKVTKNTLMRIAIAEQETWQPLDTFLKGSNAFLLIQDDMPSAIKAYQEFQKVSKKTELRGGVLEGRALNQDEVKALTELPTKDQLYARIAGGIKAIPTKLAVGTNAVPTKLAVGIKEVPNKLVRAIKAVSEKDQDQDQDQDQQEAA